MLGQFHRGEMENPVLEVDDVLICIEVGVLDVVQIRCEDAKCLIHLPHLDHLRIVGCNAVLDETFQHIVRIETVHSALVDVAQHAVPRTVTDKDVVQVLPNVICKCRTADDRISLCVEVNEIRVIHYRCMEHAVTGFHADADRCCLVVLALPLPAVECGLTKDGINQGCIVSRPKGNQGTEGGICFRGTAVLRDVTTVEEPCKLPTVLRFSQRTNDVEDGAVAVLFRTVVHGLFAQHILLQCGKYGFRSIVKRCIVEQIAREYRKAVGQSSDVEFHFVVRIFDIEFRIEFFLAVLVLCFRNAVIITATVDVYAVSADGLLGVGVMSADLLLHHRIRFVPVVNVQEIHSLRDNEADTAVGRCLCRMPGFLERHPTCPKCMIRSRDTAVCGTGLLRSIAILHGIVPTDPDFLCFEFVDGHPHTTSSHLVL